MGLPPFQRLLDRHASGLHRVLVALVGPDEADDCFQEAVLSALRSYPSLRHDDNLDGWLYSIARRKAVDAHRARGRRPSPVADPELLSGGVDDSYKDAWSGILWQHVRALPEKQRIAVTLRSVCELDYDDIARALDCSTVAARQNVSAGLARLRKELA